MGQPASVAIIVRVMDRAAEVRRSLPSLLGQDYPDYRVVIVDHSSQDGLAEVLSAESDPRLTVVRCPRPEHFNRGRASNVGVRYSFSDLLFFLDTGMLFRDAHHLSEIVASYHQSAEIDATHYAAWRQRLGVPAFARSSDAGGTVRRAYCECECHGLHLLVERAIFQQIGGLNEALQDWGYEDTDLVTRLELSGYGRIPIRGLVESTHGDDHRVRFHREKSKERTWERNRRISDASITAFGPQLKTQAAPGLCEWVEIDGVRYEGAAAPQQTWQMETAGEWYRRRRSAAAVGRPGPEEPVVSVVVPTKNASEYLVGVLDTILAQDYPHIECLVVDGGSTDATHDILETYGDCIRRITKPDRGSFDAINRGWMLSRGQILAWLNADDFWTPGAVSAAVASFRDDPSADLIYGDCLIVDGDGKVLEHRRPPEWDLIFAVESCHHMIDQPASFIRRSMAQRVGWLFPAWFHDWELWRRVSLAGGRIKRVSHLLGGARIRVDNSQYRPDILVKGLIDVSTRFFAFPGLSTELMGLRPRALSNCYLRIAQTLQYGRPKDRMLRLRLCLKAFAADPTNADNVWHIRPAGRRPFPHATEPRGQA